MNLTLQELSHDLSVSSQVKMSHLSLESSLKELSLENFQIESQCLGQEVERAFKNNPLLPGAILIEQGQFLGMLSRRRFLERISRPYALELFMGRPIKYLYLLEPTEILTFPSHTLIVTAAEQSLQRNAELLYEPILVEIEPQIYRLLDAHQLLVAQSYIHKLTTQLLKEQTQAQRRQAEKMARKSQELEATLASLRIANEQREQSSLVAENATAQAELLASALCELQQTQAQLIQTEKMSSLGQLVAGVAHEINNPVNFIYGNLNHTATYIQDLLELIRLYQQLYPNPEKAIQEQTEAIDLDFLIDDLPKMLDSMKLGAERIRQIVLSLRNFSRLDEAQRKPVDIHEGIDSTLLILNNRLKFKSNQAAISIIKEYGSLPLVECYAGQMNQVFMNILANAIDAIESYNKQRSKQEGLDKPSSITIKTIHQQNNVIILIADNGPGMTEEVKKRLFNPFFTTKPVGEGTGLGLSISYKIVVEKHGGLLKCSSTPGEGTEFWIEIPIHQGSAT